MSQKALGLYDRLVMEKRLRAEQGVLAGRLRKLRKEIEVDIVMLRLQNAEPKLPSRDYDCGCLVVDGLVWRDCKTSPNEARIARQKADNDRCISEGRKPLWKKPGECLRTAKA